MGMYFVYLVGKIYGDLGGNSASELVAIALAHALALFAAVSASINVSGGHVNPAVTFGTLLGGRISVVRAIYYWIAQLLGSIVAALLLRLVTNMVKIPTYIYRSVARNKYLGGPGYNRDILNIILKSIDTKLSTFIYHYILEHVGSSTEIPNL